MTTHPLAASRVLLARVDSSPAQSRAGETPMDFLDIKACCALVGGTRPTHPSTIYRLINRRLWPKPVRVTPGSSRWLRNECEAAIARMAELRP